MLNAINAIPEDKKKIFITILNNALTTGAPMDAMAEATLLNTETVLDPIYEKIADETGKIDAKDTVNFLKDLQLQLNNSYNCGGR